MSEMIKHILQFYKFGGKQLYYFQTYDGQGEIDVDKLSAPQVEEEITENSDENCDSCVI